MGNRGSSLGLISHPDTGRRKKQDSDGKGTFTKFSKTLGILQDHVTFLPKTGCLEW